MRNLHASGVLVGDRGVLVTGPSGAGKSALALALVRRGATPGRFVRLVADDQLLLARAGDRLVARTPAAIAGLVEIRGLGPHACAFEPAMLVDLVVRLVPAAAAPRLDPGERMELLGASLPCLDLAARDAEPAADAVLARIAAMQASTPLPRRGEMTAGGDDLGLSMAVVSTR
jgi:serine kinase of HPr protein (carbohydrate metabolism regulator)